MGGRSLAAALAVLLIAPAGAGALPASGPRETVDVTYTTTRPGTPTGFTYRSSFRQDGTPQPLRRLFVGAPPGALLDTSVPERCSASDEELRLRGDGICPVGSRVGTGFAETEVVGFGRQRFDVRAFNAKDQQFETVKQGELVSAIVRGFVRDGGLDALIPTCITGGQPPDGCPSDQSRLVASELVVPVSGRYFVTPPTCPASGRWQTPIVLTYADGVTDRVVTEQPCSPPCKSRRQVRLRRFAGARSIVAVLRGRRLRIDPASPVLDLRGLARGAYVVRFEVTTADRRRLTERRRYRTCI